MKTKLLHRLFAALLPLLLGLPLTAQIPSLINYQGRLTDAQGNPVTGNRTMAVRVYDAPTGGNVTYEETIGTVAVTNGIYSFRFGNDGDGIAAVLTGEDYLAQSVNGTEETTRTRLLAVPYALKSKESETSADAQALRLELVAAGVLPDGGGNASTNMITVNGGQLRYSFGNLYNEVVSTFQIGKYEVTWDEWQEVRAWAVENGYTDLANVGTGSAGEHPVHSVSWYDVVKWCNARSEKEGLVPVYSVNGTVYRTGEIGWDQEIGWYGSEVVEVLRLANGYRLPTEAEWEWAARGGVSSLGFTYSGSNFVDVVAWYLGTSSGAAVNIWGTGRGTWPVGQKAANELGLHDMSGNVWELCEDVTFHPNRRMRGGSWDYSADDCTVASRGSGSAPNIGYIDIGFRLARNAP